RVAANNKQESDYRFSKDLRDAIMAKADVKLPESFLKRWLYVANQGKFSKEQIEKEFDAFLNDFRWQLVRGNLMKKLDLKVEEKDIREAAEAFVAYQYAMYGMGNVPQELIREAAEKNVLTNEQQVRQLEEQVEDQKVISALKDIVALDTKKVSRKDFQALN
ncbi:MAG: trigger factor, partial [Bacteroidales bacterium]|nr:trigger factor [Bacteroidales bacterium]